MMKFDSHQVFDRLTSAFPARTLLLATATFIVAVWGLNELLVSPRQALEAQLHKNLQNLTNTYTELGSMDLSGIVTRLENEVDFLSERRRELEESSVPREKIPFLVSRLEREADDAGLRCEVNILESDSTQAGLAEMLQLDMTFGGSFRQTVGFFQRLDTWRETLLVHDFDVATNEETPGGLEGRVKFSIRVNER